MPIVEAKFADILQEDVDCIVNPANTHMNHMGGLARVIEKAGGDEVTAECFAKRPVATGQAILTTAGDLPHQGIIHVVGPIWDDGDSLEDELLYNAHKNALRIASEAQYASIAFPAVSCGIFRFPIDRAAPIAVKAAFTEGEEYDLAHIVFCLMQDDHYDAFVEAINAWKSIYDLT